MKFLQAILLIFLIFQPLTSFSQDVLLKPGNVTIFIYHKFGEDKYPTTNVSLSRFEEQMAYLKKHAYNVLPLSEIVRLMNTGDVLPDKTVAITIDDGYKSTYTGAWPILKKYDFPFTVFLYAKAVDQKYKNFLTWDQITEMRRAGVDFQDHGHGHHRFGSIPKGMDTESFKLWVAEDLQKGRKILADGLGYQPDLLALPYGEYNQEVLEVVKEMGYEAVFSQDPGSVSRYINKYSIPREPILGNDWASMQHFRMVLERADLPVENIEPKFFPSAGGQYERFCASVNPDLYRPGSLGIYVSEIGWLKPTLRNDRLCVEQTGTLLRRTNRVAFSGVEKGSNRNAIHYWLLINPEMNAPAN